MVAPTCPAPITKIFTRGGYSAPRPILWLSCAPVRSLLALACVAALGTACAAGASPQQTDRATLQAARGGERVLAADLRRRRERRAGTALRRRAGRDDPGAPERQASRDAARHQPTRHRGRRAGAARARVPPVLPAREAVLRPVHRRQRLDEGRRVPHERDERASAPRQLFSSADPYGNHNGGMLAFGPDGRLYFAMGDGGAGGDPENRSQNPSSLFGKLLSLNVATKGLKIEALGLRNAVALLVRPRQRRPLHRRRRPGRPRGDLLPAGLEPGRRELRLGRLRGPLVVRGQAARARQARPARRAVLALATAARSPAATSTAARTRRCAAATSTATTAAGSSGASRSRAARRPGCGASAFKIESVSSFGQDLAGELYAVSHGGTIYRLTP